MSRIKQLQKLHHGFHVSGGLNSVSESLGCTTPDDELGEVYESLDASARSPDCHHRASLEGPLFKRSLSTPNLLFPGYSLQFRRPGTILHRFQLDTMRSFYSRPCSRPGTPSGLETSITDHLAALTDGGRKAFRFGGDSDSEDDPDGSSPTLDTDPEFSSPILFHAAPPPTAIVTMCSPLRGAIPSIRDEKLDRACDRAIELQLEERRRSFHLASENRDSKLSIFNSTQSLTKETLQTDREMEKNVEKELEAVAQCSPPPGDLAERINKKVFVGNIGYEVHHLSFLASLPFPIAAAILFVILISLLPFLIFLLIHSALIIAGCAFALVSLLIILASLIIVPSFLAIFLFLPPLLAHFLLCKK